MPGGGHAPIMKKLTLFLMMVVGAVLVHVSAEGGINDRTGIARTEVGVVGAAAR